MRKIVYIKWFDAHEVEEPSELVDECIQEAAGFLFKRDKYKYIVARDYNHLSGQYEKLLTIPKKYVLEFKTLPL